MDEQTRVVKSRDDLDSEMGRRRSEMRDSSIARYKSILTLAGFESEKNWELANGYWPDHPKYDDVREPWWLFQTQHGLIRIGRRKRVTEIDWSATSFRGKITDEPNVTSEDTLVHAWSDDKAAKYMRELFGAISLVS